MNGNFGEREKNMNYDIRNSLVGGDNIFNTKNTYYNDVFAISKIKLNKDIQIRPFDHYHNEYEFIITVNSIGIIRMNKACYMGQAGCCYPVPTRETHGVESLISDAEFYVLEFNNAFFENYLEMLGVIRPVFHQAFLVESDLYKTLNNLINAFEDKITNDELINNLIKSLMTYLISKGVENNADQRRARRMYNSKIKDVLDYMCDNFRDPELDVHKLSEYSGFSHTYFTKTFKKYMGENPIVHLNKLRISEAKKLILADPYRKLNDIHTLVGYKTITNFTEQFKLVTGMKPKQYQYDYARPSEDKLKSRYQIKKERERLGLEK